MDDFIYMNPKQQSDCMTEIRVVDTLDGVLAGRRQEGACLEGWKVLEHEHGFMTRLFTYVKTLQAAHKRGWGWEDQTAIRRPWREKGRTRGGITEGRAVLGGLPCAQEPWERSSISAEFPHEGQSQKCKGPFHQHLVHFEKTSKQE